MPRALRVLLQPISGSRPGSVVGAELSIARQGSGTTNAVRGDEVPAKITFVASCFDKARTPERQEAELGTLSGTLLLSEDRAEPTFLVSDSDNAKLFGDPPESSGSEETPRALRVAFATSTFRLPLDLDASVARLFVPAELSAGAAHLEIIVELEVAGAAEASREFNDVLDVPLVPRPRHLVRVLDEMREPLAGLPAMFEAEGVSQSMTTDAEGTCALDDLGLDIVTFRLVEDSDLRATLKDRWNRPRPGGVLRASTSTTVVSVDEALELIEAPAGTLRTLSVQPSIKLARLLGLFFDTNKSFLLPSAMPDIKSLKALYDEHPDSELLVVGHADTTGDPSTNDPLSLERAESMAAFLKDDVDVWLGRYESGVPAKRRWGANEDFLMLQQLPDFFQRPTDEDPIRFFQRTRNLTVDGVAGPQTRRALIREYMAEDETTLPASVGITAHGCGEFFPLGAGAQNIDPDPKNPARDPTDRRVELFFFAKEFGIQPPPPGKNSKRDSREYPEWRKRAAIVLENELRFSDRALRVRFQAEGAPLANEEFSLDVDGRRLLVGRTGADGQIEQRLPVDARLAEVHLPRVGLFRAIEIELAEEFPPVEQLLGAQVRLAQLGFLIEEPSGSLDADTRDAIVAFRSSRGLSADPLFDDDTRNELRDAYGS